MHVANAYRHSAQKNRRVFDLSRLEGTASGRCHNRIIVNASIMLHFIHSIYCEHHSAEREKSYNYKRSYRTNYLTQRTLKNCVQKNDEQRRGAPMHRGYQKWSGKYHYDHLLASNASMPVNIDNQKSRFL